MSRRLSRLQPPHRHRSRTGQRGFSLVELVVVVIIIAILAVIAIPSITHRMRDRRTAEAAEKVSNIIRGARMRAMGRGAAVLVRFDSTKNPEGSLTIQEAVRGAAEPDAKCSRLPSSSCTLTSWVAPTGTGLADVTDNVLVSSFAPPEQGQFKDIYISIQGDPANAGNQTQMDLCFTPMGRAFVRYNQSGTFAPLTGVPVAEVVRKDGSTSFGLIRTVMVLPNGSTRLGTARLAP